jgi:hypothetical protein
MGFTSYDLPAKNKIKIKFKGDNPLCLDDAWFWQVVLSQVPGIFHKLKVVN